MQPTENEESNRHATNSALQPEPDPKEVPSRSALSKRVDENRLNISTMRKQSEIMTPGLDGEISPDTRKETDSPRKLGRKGTFLGGLRPLKSPSIEEEMFRRSSYLKSQGQDSQAERK